jgi:ribosomal protein S10
MSKYTLLLHSKHKKTINDFLNFFKNNTKQNFRIQTKKSKITRFSVLKSPHINKKAQEQFQYTHFCTSLSFLTRKIKKKLFFLKKIKNQLFPELKLLIKGTYSSKTPITKFLPPSSMTTYNQKKFGKLTSKNLLKKSIFHLKTLDYYGSIHIKV